MDVGSWELGVGNGEWVMVISNCTVSEFFDYKVSLTAVLRQKNILNAYEASRQQKITLKSNFSRKVGVRSREWGMGSG